MNDIVINARDIVKKFYIGEPNELEILHGMTFEVPKGQFVSIVGQSGSGKSTLMNIIGALDRPTSGTYFLDGQDISRANDKELSRIRNLEIGFVFQTFNLIARTSALKNIELPMMYAGVPAKERRKRAFDLLDIVEMTDRSEHMPNELSGGQKQRIAIARAMANDPSIILADEPTGALDSKTGRLVMDLFHKLHREQGKTIVLITHNPELAAETDRIITIADGNIISNSAEVSPLEGIRRAPVIAVKPSGIQETGEKNDEAPAAPDTVPGVNETNGTSEDVQQQEQVQDHVPEPAAAEVSESEGKA